jgi:drug/metabolite transporter (DMT)-like permease
MSGVAWALVAAVAFAVTQIFNRKSNQLIDAYRTAFGLLATAAVVLVVRAIATGEFALLAAAPISSLTYFVLATFIHFVAGWTLIALSQQRIGVARSQALVGASPLVGAVLAAFVLEEAFTFPIAAGVVLAIAGVWMVSMSSDPSVKGTPWSIPWYALTVALLWGITPQLIRLGLRGLDSPLMGVTVGLMFTVPLHALLLTVAKAWRRGPIPAPALKWMALGGLAGALAIAAQWISYDRTSVAIAITVQQLAALVVVGLVPFVFREPIERVTIRLIAGAITMLAGSALVVLAGS